MSAGEIGRIVVRRLAILWLFGRLDDAFELGLFGLTKLGLKLPRNPSLPRGLVAVGLGWLTLGRRNLEVLRKRPDVSDEVIRARIDVLAEVVTPAFAVPSLYLLIVGRLACMLDRHGHHARINYALTSLAVAIGILGRAREAGQLCERALKLAQERNARPLDFVRARTFAKYFVWPASRPFRELVTDVEAMHGEFCDRGLEDDAGMAVSIGGLVCVQTDIPLQDIRAMYARCEVRSPGFGSAEWRNVVTILRRYVDSLVDGAPSLSADELGPESTKIVRYTAMAIQLRVALFQSDHDRASELLDRVPTDFGQVLMGMSTIPFFALCSAIVDAQRCPSQAGRERRQILRKLRAQAKLLRRWAKNGPENYGPMAAIVDAEILAVLGRRERATAEYERARTLAAASGALGLVGLACTRLARLARRDGRALLAKAAFDAALDAFEAWGAAAVVVRMRELGLENSG